jgi:hypothetical protein
MKKEQEQGSHRFSEFLKKLEGSGLEVKVTTEPGNVILFVGGWREETIQEIRRSAHSVDAI